MTLADLIPVWVALASVLLGGMCLWGAIRLRVLYSIADPCILQMFQTCFTFGVLLLTGMLPIGDIFGYLLFFGVLVATAARQSGKSSRPWITEDEWLKFAYVLFWVLAVMNAYLISHKGFLLLHSNLAQARLEFYRGWGVFKRLNEFGVGILGIGGLQLWSRGKRKTAGFFISFASYLVLSLGSRAGLLVFLFLYGAYARFHVRRTQTKALLLAASILGVSSLAIFYIMFGNAFLLQFALRLLGYCDGPVYFFSSHLSGKVHYGLGYIFDEFLQAARLRAKPAYVSLGQVLNWYFMYYENPLTGPNPQFCVESHVLFGWAYLFWYGLVAWIFVYFRKHASTAYSFFIACAVVGPLLQDSQFAGSELFSAILVGILLIATLSFRRVALLASAHVRLEVAEQR